MCTRRESETYLQFDFAKSQYSENGTHDTLIFWKRKRTFIAELIEID